MKSTTTNVCPCCSEPLLRHARHGAIYWFCPHCWQEMPNLMAEVLERQVAAVADLVKSN